MVPFWAFTAADTDTILFGGALLHLHYIYPNSFRGQVKVKRFKSQQPNHFEVCVPAIKIAPHEKRYKPFGVLHPQTFPSALWCDLSNGKRILKIG